MGVMELNLTLFNIRGSQMAWSIKKSPKEDIVDELQNDIKQWVLYGGGKDNPHEMPLAALDIEPGKLAVYTVFFPLDEDDVQVALSQLRKQANLIDEPIFVVDALTSEDTGMALLSDSKIESKLKDFLLRQDDNNGEES